jgi:gliding motility-associated-like protein
MLRLLTVSAYSQSVAQIQSTPAAVLDTVTVCKGIDVTFSDNSSGSPDSLIWTFPGVSGQVFGAGPHTYSFNASGWVKLTAFSNGVGNTDSVYVRANGPTASGTLQGSTQATMFNGELVFARCNASGSGSTASASFNSTSTNVGAGTTYMINWGNGNIAGPLNHPLPTAPAPNSSFTPGLYTVTVSILNPDGCVDTLRLKYFFGNTPSAGFSNPGNSNLCLPDSMSFPISNTSTNFPGTFYVVTFNDNSTPDTLLHPPPASYVHYFSGISCNFTAVTSTGSFQNAFAGTLQAYNACGSSGVTVAPIYASSYNQTGFEVNPGNIVCENVQVTIRDTTQYGIDVGSTTCDSLPMLVWTISPSTGWSLNNGNLGATFGFDEDNGNYDPFFWASGDSILDITFTQPGSYTVRLRTGNQCGESEATQIICVDPEIVADFALSDTAACIPATINITNLSQGTNCEPTRYLWEVTHSDPTGCGNDSWAFTGGTDSTSFQPVFSFTGAGEYSIRLTVNPLLNPNPNPGGCPPKDTTLLFIAKDLPQVSVTAPPPLCENDPVTLSEQVLACYNTDSLTYSWTLTGATPSSSTAINPGTITYATFGIYPVILAVTSECGVVTETDTVIIEEPVVVDAGVGGNVCVDSPFQLAGSITGSVTTGTWSASVPGGTFAPSVNDLNAIYTPPSGYIGNIDLILISDAPGSACPPDTDQILLVVDPNAIAIPGVYPDICMDEVLPLNGSFGGAASSATWLAPSVGTITPNNAALTGNYVPPAGYVGSVTLTLVTDDPAGLCDPDTATVTFQVKPRPVASATPNPLAICSGASFGTQLSANMLNTTFSWTPVSNPLITGANSGTGDSLTDALVNLGNADEVQIYAVVPNNDGCDGDTLFVQVTVFPDAVITPTANIVLCPGDILGPIVWQTLPATNTTVAWSISNPIFGGASGVGDIPATPAPPNPGPNPEVGVVVAIPVYNGCPGIPDTFTVTINPTPDITNSPLTETVCAGSVSQQVPWTSSVAGTTYAWSVTSNNNLQPGFLVSGGDTLPGQTFNTVVLDTGTVTYTVIPTANGCPGLPVDYEITVFPLPDVILPPGQTICPNTATTIVTPTSSVPGTVFNWTSLASPGVSGNVTSGSGAIPSQTLFNAFPVQGSVTYTITPVANGCSGPPVNYVVAVDGSPNVLFDIGSQNICDGQNSAQVTLSSNTPGATFTWNAVIPPGISGAVASGTNTIPVMTLGNSTTSPITLEFIAFATAGVACSGVPDTHFVTVNPVPVGNLNPSAQTVCSNTLFTITVGSNVPGTVFNWTATLPGGLTGNASGQSDPIQEVVINTGGSSQTANYTITPTINGCPGAPLFADVTIDPEPVMVPTADITVCPGQLVAPPSFSSSSALATYSWTNNNTVVGLAASGAGDIAAYNAPANMGGTPIIGEIIVVPSLTGCAGTPDTFLITINPTPFVTTAPPGQTICSGDSNSIVPFTSNVLGAQFTWSFDNATNAATPNIVTGTDTLPSQVHTTVLPSQGSVVYLVQPVANGCPGPSANYTVTIEPSPSVNLPPVQTICSNSSSVAAVLGANVAGTQFTWTASAPAGISGFPVSGNGDIPPMTISNSNPVAGVVTFAIIPTAGNCDGDTAFYTITVQPVPDVSLLPLSQVVCDTQATQAVAFSSTTPGATFDYFLIPNLSVNGTVGNGTGSSLPVFIPQNTSAISQQLQYEVIPSIGGCPGVPDTLTITVHPTPVAIATPAAQSLCSGDTTSIVLSSLTPLTSFSWTVSANPAISGSQAGAGDSIIQILSQSGLLTETETYTVTPVANGCSGAALSVPVQVFPIPATNATANISECPGQPISPPPFTSNPAGATFNWTNSNTAIGLPASGTGDINSYTAPINPGATAIVAQIIVTPTLNSCSGVADTFSITVNPSPVIDNTPLSQTLCSGDTTSLVAFTSVVPGATFTWSLNAFVNANPPAFVFGSDTLPAQVYTNSTSLPGSVTFDVVATVNGCSGAATTYTINVNPKADVQVPAPQTLCSGVTTAVVPLTSTVAGTTFSWLTTYVGATISGQIVSGNGDITSMVLVNSGTQPDSVTYGIVPQASNCVGDTVFYTIVVQPVPVVSINPPTQSVCDTQATQVVTFSSTTPGVNFDYTLIPNPAISGVPVSGSGLNFPAVNPQNNSTSTQTFSYEVLPSINGCFGVADTFDITVFPTPLAIATPAVQDICSGNSTSVVLSSATAGTTFSWTTGGNPLINGAQAGAGDSIIQVLTLNGLAPSTEVYTVVPSANGCSGPGVQVSIQVLPIPATDPNGNITVCPGQQIAPGSFTSTPLGGTFTWTNTNTAIGLAASGNGDINSYTAPANAGPLAQTGQIIVTPTLSGCIGVPDTFLIQVNPTPDVSTLPMNQTICSGDSNALVPFTSTVAGTTFNWTVNSYNNINPIAPASGTDTIFPTQFTTINFTQGSVTFDVIPVAGGCIGATAVYTVNVEPTPDVQIDPPQTICSGASSLPVNISSSVVGTTFSWSSVSSAGVTGAPLSGSGQIPALTLINSDPVPGQVVFTIVPSTGSCQNAAVTYTITVQPEPVVTLSLLNQTICDSATTLVVGFQSSTPGAIFTWNLLPNANVTGMPAGGISDSLPAMTLHNSGVFSEVVQYQVVPSFQGCPGIADTHSILIHPTPDVQAVPNPQTICSGTSTSIGFTSSVGGTAFNWTILGNPAIAGAVNGSGNNLQQTLSHTTPNTETEIYTVTPTANGCSGPPLNVQVDVLPLPLVTPFANQSVCPNQNIGAFNFTSTPPGAQYTWTNSNPAIGLAPSGVGDIPAFVAPANAGPGSIQSQIIIRASLNGCIGPADTIDLEVRPTPVGVASPLTQTICSGQTATIQLNGNLVGTTFTWTAVGVNQGAVAGAGLGISQVLINPGTTTETTTYTITPELNGCPGASIVASVDVTPTAVIQTVSAPSVLCSGDSTNISISSSVPGTLFNWTVQSSANVSGAQPGSGNQITQTLTNPSNAPGFVSYIISSSFNGCPVPNDTVVITVNPIPTAIVTPANADICSGATTNLQLTSPVAGATFTWVAVPGPNVSGAFNGNGNTITNMLVNSAVTVDTVFYTVTPSAAGCTGPPVLSWVAVTPVPTLVANPPGLTVCSGTPFSIGLSSNVPNATISWQITPNAAISGALPGVGNLIAQTLTTPGPNAQIQVYNASVVFNNCAGPDLQIPVNVEPLPFVDAGPPQGICENVAPIFLQGMNPAGGTWSGPGITNPNTGAFDPALPGVGTHTLFYTIISPVNGCANTDSLFITVHPIPNMAVQHDSLACLNSNVVFANNTTGATQHLWNFGDGNTSNAFSPIHVYTQPGLYTVTLTSTSNQGCVNTISNPIRIITIPIAQFALDTNSGCAPVTVNIANQSQFYAASFAWNFGNGQSSTAENPSAVIYPGSLIADTTYTVSLTVSNICGSSTFTDTVQVLSNPVAFFGPSTYLGCSPLTVNFSQNSFGVPTSYFWDFGNGNTAQTVSAPSQIYTYGGTTDTTYYITLTVSNACGTSAHIDSIRILPNNVFPFFTPTPQVGCAPLPVTFQNFTAGATIYNWDFGDGNFSNAFSPTHTYTQGGQYLVRLAANNGCAFDTSFVVVDVYPQPVLNVGVVQDTLCMGDAFQFINNSVNLANIQWNFSDGGSSNLANPSHIFNGSGTFTVTVIATSQAVGCVDSTTLSVFVRPKPDVSIVLSDSIGCVPFFVSFQETAGQAMFHAWDFMDGNTGAGANTVHTFLTPGYYIVEYVGSNQWGCTDTAKVNVWANPTPTASFTINIPDACDYPTSTTVINNSTNALGYSWNFGNGQTSTQFQPVATYQGPGNYLATLVAINQFGCSDTALQVVSINQAVVAAFEVFPGPLGCAPYKVDMVNQSQFATSFFWDLGDGNTSTDENPVNLYLNPGQYTVTLIASNAAGCTDTLVVTNAVTVNTSPVAGFFSEPKETSVLNPNIYLGDLSQGAIFGFYDMGNNQQFDGLSGLFTYSNPDTGTYTIMQVVVNEFGCTDTAFGSIRLIGETTLYVPNSFSPNNDGRNDFWRAYGLFVFEYQCRVYNRWGQLIFETDDLFEGWDGTYMNNGGALSKSDVYVYRITYRDIFGERQRKTGHIVLTNNDTE